jgi:hypothetical protein
MIKHRPLINVSLAEALYSKKEGVQVKYVCTSALSKEGVVSCDIFYRASPHPVFGNHYFALYLDEIRGMTIASADIVEQFGFAMIKDEFGDLHYSQNRWDYLSLSTGEFIDGGRAYTRSNAPTSLYRVVEGTLVENTVKNH